MKRYNIIIFILAVLACLRMLIGSTSAIFLINFKNFSINEIAALKSLQFMAIVSSDIPLSYAADKISRKLSILIGILFSSMWLLTTAFMDSKFWITIAELFNALSLSFLSGAGIALIIDYYSEDKNDKKNIDFSVVISRNIKFSRLAMMIGVIISLFFSLDNLIYLWVTAGTLMLFLFFTSIFLLPKDIFEKSSANFREDLRLILREITKSKTVLLSLLFVVALTGYFNVIINYTQIITVENFPMWNSPLFHGIVFFVVLGAQYLGSHSNVKPVFINSMCMLALFTALYIGLIDWLNLLFWVSQFYSFIQLKIYFSNKIHYSISSKFRSTLDSVAGSFGLLLASAISLFFFKTYSNMATIFIFFIIFYGILSLILLFCKLVLSAKTTGS